MSEINRADCVEDDDDDDDGGDGDSVGVCDVWRRCDDGTVKCKPSASDLLGAQLM